MKTRIEAITVGNLDKMADAAASFGLSRSAGWLRRCMFDPTVEDLTEDRVRGHMAIADNGEVVAIQGYYYIPCYFRQQKLLENSGCILGAKAGFSEELPSVFERNLETCKKGVITLGNCYSGAASLKISRIVGRLRPPAYRSDYFNVGVADLAFYPLLIVRRILAKPPAWMEKCLWALARPLQWLRQCWWGLKDGLRDYRFVRYDFIDEDRFGDFWRRFLAANNGLIGSREPERLRWLFGESLKAGAVSLVAAEKNNQIDGYVMVRASNDEYWAKSYEIIDICAVKNDVRVLRTLAEFSLRLVSRLGGVKVFLTACVPNQERWLDPVLKKRKRVMPTYMYKAKNVEIEASLKRGEGWFFGPFDGERCLGNGGYVDL